MRTLAKVISAAFASVRTSRPIAPYSTSLDSYTDEVMMASGIAPASAASIVPSAAPACRPQEPRSQP